jgi:hypothetical protein
LFREQDNIAIDQPANEADAPTNSACLMAQQAKPAH